MSSCTQMASNELSLTIPSLHKQVRHCYYPYTKKEILLHFRKKKKRFTVTTRQLEESRREFTTASVQVGQLDVLITR